MIIESIKEGFDLTNRNWQLILIRVVVAMINLFLLILFIVIPFIIALLALGIDWDINRAKDFLPSVLSNPSAVFSRYLGIVVLLITAFTLYLTVVSVIILYSFGGTLGVLRNSILNIKYKFSLSSFFYEAKNLFFPLLWLLSVVLLAITIIVIIFGILTSIVITLLYLYGESESTFTVFIVSFFTLLIFFSLFLGTLGGLIYTAYSIISLVVDKKGTSESFRRTWDFLKNKPKAFLFYIILIFGMFGINIGIAIFGGVLQMIPAVGIFISIPYNLVYYAVQAYLSIVLWSVLLIYYMKETDYPVYRATYDI
jgi:hypothetical protein